MTRANRVVQLWLSVILLVCLCWGQVLAAEAIREDAYPSRLWQVEQQGKSSLILGTMHLPDADIVQLPPHIKEPVAQAQALVLEVRLTPAAQREAAELTTLRGSTLLSDLVGEADFLRLTALFQPYGIRGAGLERLKPWVAGVMLNSPPPSLEPVLDFALQFQFQQLGKPVFELESMQEQLALFDQLPMDEQLTFLRYAMAQQPHFLNELERIKALYIQDNLSRLHELATQQIGQLEDPALKRLMRAIIEERNHGMVARMKAHLSVGNRLIAIGALHLTGREGVLALLRQQGYRVTPVLPDT